MLKNDSRFGSTVYVTAFACLRGTEKSTARILQFPTGLGMRSHLQQATPNSNGNCVRPIIGPQLVHEVLDVEVNCSLRDCQLIGDLFVAKTVSNEPQHLQLTSRKILFAQMLG